MLPKLDNATVATDSSVKTSQCIEYVASNTSTLLTTLNTGTKAVSLKHGVMLTGASAIDAVRAKNMYSRCMFNVGCILEVVSSIVLGLTVFNISVGLGPIAMAYSAVGTSFFWLGRKINTLARVADVPAS